MSVRSYIYLQHKTKQKQHCIVLKTIILMRIRVHTYIHTFALAIVTCTVAVADDIDDYGKDIADDRGWFF